MTTTQIPYDQWLSQFFENTRLERERKLEEQRLEYKRIRLIEDEAFRLFETYDYHTASEYLRKQGYYISPNYRKGGGHDNTTSHIRLLLDFNSAPDGTMTYIIYGESTNLIKIGRTRQSVATRLLSVQSECDERIIPLKLINYDVENELHRKFKLIRVRHPVSDQTEWFLNDGQILDYIDELKAQS